MVCQITRLCVSDFLVLDSQMHDGWFVLWWTIEAVCRRLLSHAAFKDNSPDTPVGLSSLGVVDLDYLIMSDVFGLRVLDTQEPIYLMLLGHFRNQFRVLVPDAAATPVDFHDIILEDLSVTLESRARRIVPSDVISLQRHRPTVLYATMHKKQADMECLRCACRQQYDGAFGSGRSGACPHCDEYIVGTLDGHMIDNHLTLGQLWRCPVEWCTVERIG